MKTIAEIGINHNGDLDIAKRLIDIAAFSGFDYVKFQKRTPHKCVPEHKKDEIRKTPWGEITYLQYRHMVEFGVDEYSEINEYCQSRGIEWFASVWDLESAKFMSQFTDIVKIPSALITDLDLIKYCRNHFETLIISTGMSTEEEIREAVKVGMPNVLMHTNSTYPAPVDELNLLYIKWLKHAYGREVGYSGHEYGIETTYAAAALGATWIERHITVDRYMWGSDQLSSVEPEGMIKLVKGLKNIEKSMGTYGPRKVLQSEMSKRRDLRGL